MGWSSLWTGAVNTGPRSNQRAGSFLLNPLYVFFFYFFFLTSSIGKRFILPDARENFLSMPNLSLYVFA